MPAGERNATLARLAGSLLAKDNIPANQVVEMVWAVNIQNSKPPLKRDEVETIVKSIAQTHKRKKNEIKKDPYEQTRGFKPTDYGNAERLVAAHGQDIKYCWDWHKWLTWTGTQWREDDTPGVIQRAKKTVRSIYGEAARINDDKERRELLKFAMRSEQRDRIKAAVDLAASEP
ncbi:primase C-terminal domain-containing protein, partial [Candidatus Hakubella thermalkaliphila]|uniref:primase C-terminal domain-containing protein n=1 Tax=Candidatus Hakubella thermalkaliphila TaxID=2754717 RepID=UPI00215917AA